MVSRRLTPGAEKRRAVLPAHLGEKKFGIAENAGQRIIEFVAQEFGKAFVMREFRGGGNGSAGLVQFTWQPPRGVQMLFEARSGVGKMQFVRSDEVRHPKRSARKGLQEAPCQEPRREQNQPGRRQYRRAARAGRPAAQLRKDARKTPAGQSNPAKVA